MLPLALELCECWEHAYNLPLVRVSIRISRLEYIDKNEEKTGRTPGSFGILTTSPDSTSAPSMALGLPPATHILSGGSLHHRLQSRVAFAVKTICWYSHVFFTWNISRVICSQTGLTSAELIASAYSAGYLTVVYQTHRQAYLYRVVSAICCSSYIISEHMIIKCLPHKEPFGLGTNTLHFLNKSL